MSRKKKASNSDLSGEGGRRAADLEEELGSGLFDRFSTARKTLGRGSVRSKKGNEDTVSLGGETGERAGWKSKLANRLRGRGAGESEGEVAEVERGSKEEPPLPARHPSQPDLLSQQTPMTEPTRRKPFNIEDGVDQKDSGGQAKGGGGRKSSYILPGDYDSQLVDGKYLTTVPIINVEQAEEGRTGQGNIRPGHSLKDLKKPVTRKNSLIERLSRSNSSKEPRRGALPQSQSVTAGSNVFDRLSSGAGATAGTGSRASLASSRPSLAASPASRPATSASRATSLPPDKPKGTLNKIRDLSKDITKNLRKGKEEGLSSSSGTIVKPRNSNSLFGERKPMSNLNGGSNPSIASSTRSLNKSSPLAASTVKLKQKSVSTTDTSGGRGTARPATVTIRGSNSTSSLRSPASPLPKPGGSSKQPGSSKENLSRSSSSASRSSVSGGPGRGMAGPGRNTAATLPRTTPRNLVPTAPAVPSYMKPTAARTKKVLSAVSEPIGPRKGTARTLGTTSARVTPVAARPSRR